MDFSVVKKGYAPKEVDEYIAAVRREYEATIVKQRERIKEMLTEKEETERELALHRDKSNQIGKAIVSAVAKAEEIERLSRIKYSQEIMRLKEFHEKWTKYYDKILDAYPLDDRLAAAGEFNRRMDTILSRVGDGDMAATRSEPSTIAPKNTDDVRIGYISVKAENEGGEADITELLPDADPTSPVLTGDFDPMERIGRYFAAEKERQQHEQQKRAEHKSSRPAAAAAPKDYADRSPSGFSFEEALNPTEDLESILKDLGF